MNIGNVKCDLLETLNDQYWVLQAYLHIYIKSLELSYIENKSSSSLSSHVYLYYKQYQGVEHNLVLQLMPWWSVTLTASVVVKKQEETVLYNMGMNSCWCSILFTIESKLRLSKTKILLFKEIVLWQLTSNIVNLKSTKSFFHIFILV